MQACAVCVPLWMRSPSGAGMPTMQLASVGTSFASVEMGQKDGRHFKLGRRAGWMARLRRSAQRRRKVFGSMQNLFGICFIGKRAVKVGFGAPA